MMYVDACNKINKDHLENVIADMRVMGSPVIRVISIDGRYLALEGSHRLEAAHILQIAPTFVEIAEGDAVIDHDLDYDVTTAGAMVDYIGGGKRYEIEEDFDCDW